MNTQQLVQHLIIALQEQGMGIDEVKAWIESARRGETNLKVTPEQIQAMESEVRYWEAATLP